LRCFENNPAVSRVYHQPVKSGFRERGVFDYSFYEGPKVGIHVAKETIGGFDISEAEFSPLPFQPKQPELSIGKWRPSRATLARVKPLVVLRDPMQTWASIERLNIYSDGLSPYYSPFDLFIASYTNVAEFALNANAQGLPVLAWTLERIGDDPKARLARLCQLWDIPWSSSMVDWTHPLGVNTWYSEEARERMRVDPRFIRSKESLAAASRFFYTATNPDGIVKIGDGEVIRRRLLPLYEQFRRLGEESGD